MDKHKSNLIDWQVNNLVRSITAFYMRDVPPPDKVEVPINDLRWLDKSNTFLATVHIGVNWITERYHTVSIRFKANNFNIIPKSISYNL
jgi:hypothetical protein